MIASYALRSLAEEGLSARTRYTEGALLERWLAQCGIDGLTIHDRAYTYVGTLS